FLMFAYAGWSRATYERIARGVVVVASLVGAYATVRWLVGPSGIERDHAVAVSGPYDYVDGHLRVFGPFSSGHTLAAWTAVAIPFCLAIALWLRGWWRFLAGVACVLCAFALLASEVRVGLAGAGLGVFTVVALYQLSRGFRGLHLG